MVFEAPFNYNKVKIAETFQIPAFLMFLFTVHNTAISEM